MANGLLELVEEERYRFLHEFRLFLLFLEQIVLLLELQQL